MEFTVALHRVRVMHGDSFCILGPTRTDLTRLGVQGCGDGVDDLLQLGVAVDVAVSALLRVDQFTVDGHLEIARHARRRLARQ